MRRVSITSLFTGVLFQSTHPLRGATGHSSLVFHAADISIHAPLAGCDIAKLTQTQYIDISIHAPLAGCDAAKSGWRHLTEISIHAPLAGCDRLTAGRQWDSHNFNPRTPCGVRQKLPTLLNLSPLFQSTHPLRGATMQDFVISSSFKISIHAPLAGCDAESRIADRLKFISIHAPLAGCDIITTC